MTAARNVPSRLTPQQLRARWQQMIADPLLARLPHKLELNEKGAIEVSPATSRHAFLQAFLAGELRRLRPEGTTFTECPVETRIGVRVPDVAWASPEFVDHHGMPTPLPKAPELCIEVLSPSNSRAEIADKAAAYLAAGAREVWLVPENGAMEIITAAGQQPSSSLGIDVLLPE